MYRKKYTGCILRTHYMINKCIKKKVQTTQFTLLVNSQLTPINKGLFKASIIGTPQFYLFTTISSSFNFSFFSFFYNFLLLALPFLLYFSNENFNSEKSNRKNLNFGLATKSDGNNNKLSSLRLLQSIRFYFKSLTSNLIYTKKSNIDR